MVKRKLLNLRHIFGGRALSSVILLPGKRRAFLLHLFADCVGQVACGGRSQVNRYFNSFIGINRANGLSARKWLPFATWKSLISLGWCVCHSLLLLFLSDEIIHDLCYQHRFCLLLHRKSWYLFNGCLINRQKGQIHDSQHLKTVHETWHYLRNWGGIARGAHTHLPGPADPGPGCRTERPGFSLGGRPPDLPFPWRRGERPLGSVHNAERLGCRNNAR